VVKSELDAPSSVLADSLGNLFYVQRDTHTLHWISSSNISQTLAGSYKKFGSANCLGKNASFYNPTTAVFESKGRLFVADSGNKAIRMVTWT
jgi:hypothetical protein